MSYAKDLFKNLTGQNLDDLKRQLPTSEGIKREIWKEAMSKYPTRPIGTDAEGSFLLTEEDRSNHIHILGTTREGKSKLLEKLLQQDVNNGYGATLLDPTDNGQTAYNVLRYCIKQGYEKVCFIDPHDYTTAIPTLNPLRWREAAATDAVVSSVMGAIRLLWSQRDFSDTPRIETYLAAVLTALYHAQMTIPDAECFTVKENKIYDWRRRQILEHLHAADNNRAVLEEVFNVKGQQLFLGEFKASIRRLKPFFGYLPKLMYGSTESPIDFRKLISDKWVILVNLDPTRLWGSAEQRVLATLIVNEITTAVSDLTFHGWVGRHYLYIDEAGQFTTRALADIMAYKGKSGLWATLSHQFYNQFEDRYVLDAVENLCKIKVLFHTPNAQDRSRMVRDMYFGEVKDEAVDLSLKKQHCVVKVDKQPAVVVRVDDVKTPEVDKETLGRFKEAIYQANPWYRSEKGIQEETKDRFAGPKPAQKPGGDSGRDTVGNTSRPDAQRADDQHSAEQAPAPEPPGGSTVLPRQPSRPKRQKGVQSSFLSAGPKVSSALGGKAVEKGPDGDK